MGQAAVRAALPVGFVNAARPAPLLPILAAAATGFQVGAAAVATRFVIGESDPAALALLRYLIAFCCLAPVVFYVSRQRIEPRHWLPISLLGMAQFGLLVWLFNIGLIHITAALGALIFSTAPLLTLVFAVAARQEVFTRAKVIGILLSLAGVAVAMSEGVLAGAWQSDTFWGGLAVFGSALTAAACNVLYQPYLARYQALPVALLSIFAAVCCLTLWVALAGSWEGLSGFSSPGWGAVVFIGVSSAVGFWLWTWALKHALASRAAIFLTLSPFVAMTLGYLLLGEAVTLAFFAGLTMVAAGLVLALR